MDHGIIFTVHSIGKPGFLKEILDGSFEDPRFCLAPVRWYGLVPLQQTLKSPKMVDISLSSCWDGCLCKRVCSLFPSHTTVVQKQARAQGKGEREPSELLTSRMSASQKRCRWKQTGSRVPKEKLVAKLWGKCVSSSCGTPERPDFILERLKKHCATAEMRRVAARHQPQEGKHSVELQLS